MSKITYLVSSNSQSHIFPLNLNTQRTLNKWFWSDSIFGEAYLIFEIISVLPKVFSKTGPTH
jgi:hypothetical protein